MPLSYTRVPGDSTNAWGKVPGPVAESAMACKGHKLDHSPLVTAVKPSGWAGGCSGGRHSTVMQVVCFMHANSTGLNRRRPNFFYMLGTNILCGINNLNNVQIDFDSPTPPLKIFFIFQLEKSWIYNTHLLPMIWRLFALCNLISIQNIGCSLINLGCMKFAGLAGHVQQILKMSSEEL